MSPPSAADAAAQRAAESESPLPVEGVLASPWRRTAVLLVWTAGILAIDQATKAYAIANLQPTGAQPISYANDLFRIQYAENPGAFLSLMRDWPPQARFWVLTVMNGAVLAFVGLLLLVKRPADAWMWHALALIMAGGLGNLIDRIRFDSHVIDFMNVGVGGLRTGIFNVADMAITAGFLMLLPMLFAGSDKTAGSAGSDKSQVANHKQITN